MNAAKKILILIMVLVFLGGLAYVFAFPTKGNYLTKFLQLAKTPFLISKLQKRFEAN